MFLGLGNQGKEEPIMKYIIIRLSSRSVCMYYYGTKYALIESQVPCQLSYIGELLSLK